MSATGDASAPLSAQERAHCATLAALLAGHGALGLWGLLLSALALATLCLGTASGLAALGFAATALLGLPERYLALRLRLDERLFGDLVAGRIPNLPALDQALGQLGLRKAAAAAVRPLADRLHGARRLMRRHASIVASQSLLTVVAIAADRFQFFP